MNMSVSQKGHEIIRALCCGGQTMFLHTTSVNMHENYVQRNIIKLSINHASYREMKFITGNQSGII